MVPTSVITHHPRTQPGPPPPATHPRQAEAGAVCFFNLEHIFPLSRGGISSYSNLMALHFMANSKGEGGGSGCGGAGGEGAVGGKLVRCRRGTSFMLTS